MAYLTRDEYCQRSRLPINVLDRAAVTDSSVDWIAEQLAIESSYIDSRLRKKYAVPFIAPFPRVVIGWLVALVDRLVALRVGYNPTNTDGEEYKALAEAAIAELEEAAKSADGLYDLPILVTDLLPAVSGTTEAGALEGAYARRARKERNLGHSGGLYRRWYR